MPPRRTAGINRTALNRPAGVRFTHPVRERVSPFTLLRSVSYYAVVWTVGASSVSTSTMSSDTD